MEKTTQSAKKGLSSPHIQTKDMSFGDNKTSVGREIRETITLPSGAWVGIEGKGLIRVNSCLYNLKYYELIPSDSVQKEVIKKALRQLFPHTTKDKTTQIVTTNTISDKVPGYSLNTIDTELNQIVNIEKLLKKISLWNIHKEKAKTTTDENKFILIGRQLKKDREAINSLLSTLKQDSCFSIKDSFIHYQGQYANCKRLVPEGGF